MPGKRSLVSTRVLVWALMVVFACGGQFPVLADAIALSVVKGPGSNQVTLNWSGGTAPLKVFRGTLAPSVLDPSNLLATTSGSSYTDAPPAAAVTYYSVTGLGPPEIQSIDRDGGSFGDRITIYGQNFGSDRAAVVARFSYTDIPTGQSLTVDQPVFKATDSRLDLAVPMATPNVINKVTVYVGGTPSNTVDYLVGPLPLDPTPGVAGDQVAQFVDETDALMAVFDGKLDPWFLQTGALGPADLATLHAKSAEVRGALAQLREGVLNHASGDLAAMDCILGTPEFQDLLQRVRDARAALHGSPLGSIMCEGAAVRDVVRDIIAVINIVDEIMHQVQTALDVACAASSILALFSVGIASPLAAVICTAAVFVNTVIAPVIDAITQVANFIDRIVVAAPIDFKDGTLEPSITHALWGGVPAYVYVQGNVPNRGTLTADFHNQHCLPNGCDIDDFDITIYGITITITITVPYLTVPDLGVTCHVQPPASGPDGYVDLGTTGDNDVCQFTGADIGSGQVRGNYPVTLATTCNSVTYSVSQTFPLVNGPTLVSGTPGSSQLNGPVDILGTYMPPLVTGDVNLAGADYGDASARMLFSENDHYRFHVPDTANPNGQFVLTVQGRSSNPLPFTILPPVLTDLRINPAFEGEEVEAHGTGFARAAQNNHLTLNGQPVAAERVEPFGLVFRVPNGASSGPVQVIAVTHPSNTLPLTVLRWGQAPGVRLSHPDRNAYNPALAVHGDGTVGVAWIDRHAGGGEQRLLFTDAALADGSFRAPVVVAPTLAGTELLGPPSAPQSPDVAIGPAHDFHVAWSDAGGNIRVASFAKGSAPGPGVVAIAAGSGKTLRDPAIAVMSNGSVHVAATETDDTGDIHNRLLHAVSSDGGATFSTPVPFGAVGAGTPSDDLLMGDVDLTFSNGRLWRAWTQYAHGFDPNYGDVAQREVFTQSSIDGLSWTAPEGAGAGKVDVPHAGIAAAPRGTPSVSGDAGGAVVAWDTATSVPYAANGPTDIYVSRQVQVNAAPYAAVNVGVVTPAPFGTITDVGHASLVHHTPGGDAMTVVAAVRREPGTSPDLLAGVPRVHVRRFPLRQYANTTLFETMPTVVGNDTTTIDADPALGVDAAEHYHLAWLQGPAGHRVVRYTSTRPLGWPDAVPDDPALVPAAPRDVLALQMGLNVVNGDQLFHNGTLLLDPAHPHETRWIGVAPVPYPIERAGRPTFMPSGRLLYRGAGNLYGACTASLDDRVAPIGHDDPSRSLFQTIFKYPQYAAGRIFAQTLLPFGTSYEPRVVSTDLATGQITIHESSPPVREAPATEGFAVAPGGQYYAYADPDGLLWLHDLQTGLDVAVPHNDSNNGPEFGWSPAGDRLLYTYAAACSAIPENFCWYLADYDPVNAVSHVYLEADVIAQPSYSPDGSAVVYRCAGIDCCDPAATSQQLSICTSNGQLVPRVPGVEDSSPVWSPDGTGISFVRWDANNAPGRQLMLWTIGAPQPVALTAPVLGLPDGDGMLEQSWTRVAQP